MTTNTLTYVNYDFDDLVTALEERLALLDSWKDIYTSSTGQALIELFAAVGNLTLYMLERRAEESYLLTAKNLSSIINLVKLINYAVKRKVSATGTLTFSISTAHGKLVYLPKWTECQTSDGTMYLTSEEAALSAVSTSVGVDAIQGTIIALSITSTGVDNFTYDIEDDSIENTNVYVYVDGVEWTSVTSFIDSVNTSTHYALEQDIDNNLTVVFGNDIYGKAPVAGATILIKYIRSKGSDGNAYSTGSVTTINDTLYDEDGDSVTSITVSNTTSFLGGDDAETIEEIRSEAPRVFATGDRAVTKADYAAILDNYAGVATSNAWGEQEDYDDLDSDAPASALNLVKLCILLEDWKTIDEETGFQATLTTYLKTKSMLTVKYEFVEPEILEVIIVFDVIKVVSGYSLSDAQAIIETTLEAEFVLGSTVVLGTDKKYSNLVRIVDVLDEVSYHHMHVEIYKELDATYDSVYDYGELLEADALLESNVKIYVTDDGVNHYVAIDDGAEGITALDSTYVVTSGSVDYTTGEVLVSFSSLPSTVSAVYVRYRQDESNDIIVDKDEIPKLKDVEVTSISIDS